MTRAVFFDLDGTLYDRDATIRGIVEEQRDVFRGDLHGIEPDAFVSRVIALDNHGYCRTREVYESIAVEFSLSQSLVERLIAHYWARFDAHCLPLPDAHDTLDELRRRGVRLGIITNGTAQFQQHKVDVLGLRPLLNVVVVSESEGISKPHPEIFARAAARVGATVADCCYVGDHPELDVAGAAAAGMLAVWKYTPYWTLQVPAPTITRLAAVLPLVQTAGSGPRG